MRDLNHQYFQIIQKPLTIFVTSLFVLTILGSIGDTLNYISNDAKFLGLINVILLLNLIGAFLAYRLGYVKLKPAVVVMVVFTSINIVATNSYMKAVGMEGWEYNYLRDIPVFLIFQVLVAIVFSWRVLLGYDLFLLGYYLYLGLTSGSQYLQENSVLIALVLIGFSFIVNRFVVVMRNTVFNNMNLQDEVFQQKQEHLEKVVELKNKELTHQAMLVAQSSEAFGVTIEKLEGLLKSVKGEDQKLVKSIISDLSFLSKNDVWGEFQTRFENVHEEFYRKLVTYYPDLTKADKKLAALLKLGLSSKEIAALTSNSVASVEVARSRLRKKLSLEKSENLQDFLSNY